MNENKIIIDKGYTYENEYYLRIEIEAISKENIDSKKIIKKIDNIFKDTLNNDLLKIVTYIKTLLSSFNIKKMRIGIIKGNEILSQVCYKDNTLTDYYNINFLSNESIEIEYNLNRGINFRISNTNGIIEKINNTSNYPRRNEKIV